MQVICLEESAFYELIEKVVNRLQKKQNTQKDKWVCENIAMQMLHIKSKTTLQKLRDEGKINLS